MDDAEFENGLIPDEVEPNEVPIVDPTLADPPAPDAAHAAQALEAAEPALTALEAAEAEPAGPEAAQQELTEGPVVIPEAEAAPPSALAPEAEATLAALTAAAETPQETETERAPRLWLPFLIYFVAWLAFCGLDFYLLLDGARARDLVADAEYPALLFGALGMAAIGLILVPIVWLRARARTAPGRRTGLLARAMILGAGATLAGVAVWWLVIYLLDMVVAGRLHIG